MAKILINEAQLSSIADSIREKWWLAGSMQTDSIPYWTSQIITTSEYMRISNSYSLSFPILKEVYGGAPWNPTTISLPNITKIGDYAFCLCENLREITIPACVTSIGNYAFIGCKRLESLIFEDGEKTLTLGYNTYNTNSSKSKGLFRDCPLETIYLGRNIEYESYNDKSSEAAFYAYGYSAFANIPTLNTVTINVPEGVTSFLVGKYAFRGCSGITSATFTPSTDWYNSSSASMSGGTAVEVSDSSGAASVLKSMGENYLYWKE